jgi:copper transport protein
VVTVTADLIHLAAMSIWVGGLVVLARFLIPRAPPAELGAIVPVWSRYATYAVSALLLTGVAQALIEVGTVDALFGTKYGWLVVAKAGLFAAVLGVAWLSRRLVGAIEAGDEEAGSKLRRTVVLETVITAVVIGVASVLVQTTPARTPETPPVTTRAAIQTATLRSDLYELRVEVDPGATGINFVHLYAYTLDGKVADVAEWKVRAAPPDASIEPLEVTMLPLPPGHATGQVSLPVAGTWKFSFTLRTTEVDQATVTADITVR